MPQQPSPFTIYPSDGGGSSSPGVSQTKEFTQVGHGLSVGQLAYFDGTWKAARANASTTLAEAIVVAVSGSNLTLYLLAGLFVTIASHGLGAAGTALYLSASVAGSITSTEPSGGGEFSQIVGQVVDADTLGIQTVSAEGPL